MLTRVLVDHTGGDPVRQSCCVCAASVREPGEPEAALHAHHLGDERAGRRRTGAHRSGCAAGGSGTVPAHCDVRGVIRPSRDSEIKFALWLPAASAWNAKYRQEGNGGWAGAINTASFAEPLRRGYAVAGTDDGHAGGAGANWAIGHPEKLIDFGYRAVHETAVQSKAIIRAFYGRDPERSYFDGCSDGGREALMEAQRFPEDFNGILAGAPANNWSHLFTAFVWNERALLATPDSAIPPAKLPVIQRAVMAACDRLDGVADGLIENPRACTFDPAVLRLQGCGRGRLSAQGPGRRAAEDLRGAAQSAHPGTHLRRTAARDRSRAGQLGRLDHAGERRQRHPVRVRQQLLRGSGIRGSEVDFPDARLRSRREHRRRARRDRSSTRPAPTCGRSVRQGGKLIQYHGWGDAAIPAPSSIEYYETVRAFLSKYPDPRTPGAPPTEDFYRLFLVPGMAHCGGGSGPNSFGNGGGGVATSRDPERDIFTALERWVERGVGPERLVGTGRAADDPSKSLTRPLCPYPQVAQYRGSGDVNDAANFACAAPSSR